MGRRLSLIPKSLAALNSLVERKSRWTYLARLDRKSSEQTRDAVIKRLGRFQGAHGYL